MLNIVNLSNEEMTLPKRKGTLNSLKTHRISIEAGSVPILGGVSILAIWGSEF